MKRIENEESRPNAENEMWNTAKEESTRRNDENAGKRAWWKNENFKFWALATYRRNKSEAETYKYAHEKERKKIYMLN